MAFRRVVAFVSLLASLAACRAEDDHGVATAGAAEASVAALNEARPIDPDAELGDAVERAVDGVVESGLARGDAPGAVVLIVHGERVLLRKAYGQRAVAPEPEPMTVDTVFDLASLTKPLATALSTMVLVDRGKLRLGDRVARYLPAFADGDKAAITVEELLLHTSGFPRDLPRGSLRDEAALLDRIAAMELDRAPGSRFSYSDVGYVVLGAIVRRAAGVPLEAFFRTEVAEPLGLEASFSPAAPLVARAAPTERASGRADAPFLRGRVHDPAARALGGAAGHAGLFATADDVAILARMILGQGEVDGHRLLRRETLERMTAPRRLPGGGLRALGWDVSTGYSSNRGDLFGAGSFGHTGFTGTSIWIAPTSRTAVILLTSRLHPSGRGNVKRMQRELATAVARIVGAMASSPAEEGGVVRTGLEVLADDGYVELAGRRVALVTNPSGVDGEGVTAVDRLRAAPGVHLVALFSPEHGLRADEDDAVSDRRDKRTGLPVFSLYGPRRRPGAPELAGVDTLVVDLQDAGAPFYTYESTLGELLETAKEHHLRVVVLDRPNPLGGAVVEGPMLDAGKESFTGWHRLPIRHGMTLGELALFLDAERDIGVDLRVVRMEGWRRERLFAETGLRWTPPSPNLSSPTAALLYPGVALLELTNVSVGRGTDRPFQLVGAPWIDASVLAAALGAEHLEGVRITPARFTPATSAWAGTACEGVAIEVVDPRRLRPVRIGLALARALRTRHGSLWRDADFGKLLANDRTLEQLRRGDALDAIEAAWQDDLASFRSRRERFLLY